MGGDGLSSLRMSMIISVETQTTSTEQNMQTHSAIPLYRLYGQQEAKSLALSFNVQRIETFIDKTGTYHHPHRHPNLYQFVWTNRGTGTHNIDLQSYQMRPNSLFALSPGIVHDCKSELDLGGYILHFSPSFLLSEDSMRGDFLLGDNYYEVAEATAEEGHEIDLLFEKILAEALAKRKGYLQVIRALIHILLIYKHRMRVKTKSDWHDSNTLRRQFDQLVDRHYLQERQVQYYATQLHISVSHLNNTIKTSTGISASEHIRQRIILEAKRQLSFSKASTSEIAFQLGFDDPNYFWKYFKRYTGFTPGQFKQKTESDRKAVSSSSA